MDGNRRWAKARGLSSGEGHKAGLGALLRLLEGIRDSEVKHLAVYALSSENWNRSELEIKALLQLFRSVVTEHLDEIKARQVALHFLGDLDRFPKDLRTLMVKAESETTGHDRHLWICASYGGRAEITAAAEAYKQSDTDQNFESYLWSNDLPDPEIIIRTGGNKRLSNFLLWKAAYSELYFTDTLWPEFSIKEFQEIMSDYQARVMVNKGK